MQPQDKHWVRCPQCVGSGEVLVVGSKKDGTEIRVFVAGGISEGMLVRLARVRRGWRQADLAEISTLERGRYVIPGVRHCIFRALDLDLKGGGDAPQR